MLRALIFRTLTTNVLVMTLGLVNSILLSRWLGPTGRGEIAAAMLWPTMLIYLSSFGLIAALLYFSALPEADTQRLFSNATTLALGQGALAIAFGFLAMPFLLRSQTADVVNASRWYLPVILLSLVTQYGTSILQGCMRITAFNWLRLILPVGYLVGTLILMSVRALNLRHIIFLHLALNLIALMATIIMLSQSHVRLRLHLDLEQAKPLLKYGAKVHVGNLSAVANMNLDQALMAAWLPANALGLYVVAVSAASLMQVFSQAVQMVSTPSITQKGSVAEQSAVLQGIFRRYWLLSLLLGMGIAMLLPLAIPLVFGASFKASVLSAEILLCGMFFIGAKDVLAGGAQALGNPWLGSKAQLIALIVTVVALYFLLPRWGIVGAATATAAAYTTQFIIVITDLRRIHGISPVELFRIKSQEVTSMFNFFGAKKVA
ncbi:MAG: polysaccharide biosynthesis C-terminal domain-containing protein [Acidobacteriota bacterium]